MLGCGEGFDVESQSAYAGVPGGDGMGAVAPGKDVEGCEEDGGEEEEEEEVS